jgi:hypothetical protein
MAGHEKKTMLILTRFDSPASLLKAAREMRDAGYKKFDCHSPFPIHGLDHAMGLRRSRLSFIVGACAAIGLSGAFLMQYWMSAVDYPLVLSGKPYNSFQSDTPVVFAIAVLLAAIAAFIGMLTLSGLPRHHHPAFNSEAFERFADDAFFISVDSTDPLFDTRKTSDFLLKIGGTGLEVLEG